MEISLYLSIAAILISLVSLGWSIYIGNRDKGKLLVTSQLYNSDSDPFIKIKAVNYGRRPIILTTLWACYPDKTASGTYLHEKSLNENEQFEKQITKHDCYYYDEDGSEKIVIDYYFEDTVGRVYRVRGVKKHLEILKSTQ